MKHFCGCVAVLFAIFIAVPVLTDRAHAETVTQLPTFSATGNVWAGGGLSVPSLSESVGVNLNGGFSVGSIADYKLDLGFLGTVDLGSYGAEVSAATTGDIGVGLNATFNDPTYRIDNPYAVRFTLPDPGTAGAGEGFTLGMTATPADTTLTTSYLSPSFDSNFYINNLGASVAAEVCFVGCASGSQELFGPINVDVPLLQFDNPGGGVTPSLKGPGGITIRNFPTTSSFAFADATVYAPNVVNSSTASGRVEVNSAMDLFALQANISTIVQTATGLPLNNSISMLEYLNLSYTTIEGRIGPKLALGATSAFTPGALLTQLTFDSPVGVWNDTGHTSYSVITSLTLADGETRPELFLLHPDETVTVTPTYVVADGSFASNVNANLSLLADLKLLEANIYMAGPGLPGVPDPLIDLSAGPAYTAVSDTLLKTIPLASSEFSIPFLLQQGNAFDLMSSAGICQAAGTVSSGFLFDRLCSGTLTKVGPGSLELFADNSYAGGTVLGEGSLVVETDGNLGDAGGTLTFAGGTLRTRNFDADPTGIVASRPVFLAAAGGTFDSNGLDSTLSGVISGDGYFIKAGSGALTLSGLNTYTGATNVAGGTLALSGQGRLSNVTAVDVAGGALFDLSLADGDRTVGSLAGSGSILLGDNSLATGGNSASSEFSGSIVGSGGLAKTGSGTQILSGINTYTGSTALLGGTLSVPSESSLGSGGGLVFDGGALQTTGSFTTNRAVILNSGGGTFDTSGAAVNLTLDTDIVGTGSLTKAGGGRLALTGNNLYSGGTLINDGVLELKINGALDPLGAVTVNSGLFDIATTTAGAVIGSLAGNGDVNLGAVSLTTGGNNFDTVFGGVVSGSGSLAKVGAGALELTGASTVAGGTTVAGGQLVVNGSLLSGVDVLAGAALGGNGLIRGSVNNQGHIAPGNSIGTLQVDGAYVQSAGSTYVAEVAPDGSSDLISVTGAPGTATLTGGTVAGMATGSADQYGRQAQFTILTATGGVSGAFDAATINLAVFDPYLIYGSNSVLMLLNRNDLDFAAVSGARTNNQRAVAGVLSVASTQQFIGEFSDALNVFADQLTPTEQQRALDTLGGQQVQTGLSQTGVVMVEGFSGSIDARLGRLHGSAHTADSRRNPLDGVMLAYNGDDLSGFVASDPDPRDESAWLRAYGVLGEVDGDENAAGYDYDIAGLAVGLESAFGRHLRLGVSGGYSTADIAYDDHPEDDGGVKSFQGSLYGSYVDGSFFLDGQAVYAHNFFDSTRRIHFGSVDQTAYGNYRGDEAHLQLKPGYTLHKGNAYFEPSLALEWSYLRLGGVTETGAGGLGLVVDARAVHSFKLSPGINAAYQYRSGDTLWVPELRARWSQELAERRHSFEARFVGAPAAGSFDVDGVEMPRGRLELGLALTSIVRERLHLLLDLGGTSDFGTQETYTVTGGVKYLW